MPRQESRVKSKHIETPGLVDLHFHGAFGIDLMRAKTPELDELSRLLWKNGIAGFCPTTLSAPSRDLHAALERIGSWITERRKSRVRVSDAVPLGIHLEGPFLSQKAAGAHPSSAIRPFSMEELLGLWEASRGTLKILTLAADEIPPGELARLVRWARENRVTLSIGHTHASEAQAKRVFDAGVSSVTHAWNALAFHHREPGVVGAALGRKDVFLELILDQVHVSPTLLRWTCELHGQKQVCFVSDCVPAAKARGARATFGGLSVQLAQGAAHLADGSLAGGGMLLSEAYARWVGDESRRTGFSTEHLLKKTLVSLTSAPLRALSLSPKLLSRYKVRWEYTERLVRLKG